MVRQFPGFASREEWNAAWAAARKTPPANFPPDCYSEFILLRKQDEALGIYAHLDKSNLESEKDLNTLQWVVKSNRHYGGIRRKRDSFGGFHLATRMAAKSMGGAYPHPWTLRQHQRYSIQLISRTLSLRPGASLFTLILDDLNQRAGIVIQEHIRRAISRNINVVVIGFETKDTENHLIKHIPAWDSTMSGDELLTQLKDAMKDWKESLVIVDNISDLVNIKKIDFKTLFNLVGIDYYSTIVGIYHMDLLPDAKAENAYKPEQLEMYKFMATTIMTCKSFAHELAAKAAKERSLPEPTHGLLQGAEGVIQDLDANYHQGIVIEAEFRRKSGRPMTESFYLRAPRAEDYNEPTDGMAIGTLKDEYAVCLSQVPAFTDIVYAQKVIERATALEEETTHSTTFDLGLTDKQKKARDEVVLPYFDAQKSMGDAGEGGRILYDMGSEDDFDEEEDEI